MDYLWNLTSFIVALGILVTFHEYGHFIVARKLGVKVLTFSIGFGKPLWQRVGKDGVRYVIATIPLGGYVKMLGEQAEDETPLTQEEQKQAFNRQSVWVRMAIVLAGPAANFLLAILLYWIIFLNDTNQLKPVIAEPVVGSIAAEAGLKQGDQIVKVDGIKTPSYQDLNLSLVNRMGESSSIELQVLRENEPKEINISLDISQWAVDEQRPDVLKSLGLVHIMRLSIIGEVGVGSAADKAGLLKGDQIISVDSQPTRLWSVMAKQLSQRPGQTTQLEVLRNGELITIPVVLDSREHNGERQGVLGVSLERQAYLVKIQADPLQAIEMAFAETYRMIVLTVRMFKKLLFGEISHKSLSGPFAIAEGAGTSASYGILAFLSFLALISVNLGFINLLPVPMLDGGHFLYFVIEAVRGKPLSEQVQSMGLQIGMLLVFGLMAMAIFNDLSRFSFL
jgi:regulator of sigma E protease